MRIKKFTARTMPEALQQVKRELGPDAIIIHSRRLGPPVWRRLLRRPLLEVIAAVDGDHRAWADGARPRPIDRAFPAGVGPPVGWEERSPMEDVRRDVAELRSAVRKLAEQPEMPNVFKLAPNLVECYRRLIGQDVEPELAQELVLAADRELSGEALQDPETVEDCVRRHLARLVVPRDPLPKAGEPGRVVFLVGPTGVGKTTTIAKLAANFALSGKGKVGLITTDTFRIAAIPQLQTYAEIIQVPLEVVYSPAELRELVRRHQDKQLLLVDTPGRSPRNGRQLQELAVFIKVVERREVLLTLACPTKSRDLLSIVERFAVIPYGGLLFTKLDETCSFGPLVNLARHLGKPVTYLTTGQNVPHDIEAATPSRVADLVLGGAP